MNQVSLNVKTRKTGKQETKKIRREGNVPGVFYRKDITPVPFYAQTLDLRSIVYTSETKIIDLFIDDKKEPVECILKDMVFEPVTEELVHLDLMGITRGQLMIFEIPIILKGQSVGVREGGLLQQSMYKVRIQCLPKNLPTHIEVDISELALNNAIYLKDIEVDNIELMQNLDSVITSVVPPRVIKDTLDEEEGEVEEVVEGEEADSEESKSEE